MEINFEIESFINQYVKELNAGTASIFAGAGFSIPAGYVNWSELMTEIAEELGLDINLEKDLVSIAQYHLNENRTRAKLNQKIIEEFILETCETENHRIISRLPISSIWTTNYDTLIENTFIKSKKNVDVKFTVDQLLITKPKRDIVIFKMHGDVNHPNDTILTKEQYEQYHQTPEPFINALSGELITKTFLFIGFSFSDPNLDYVLSRLNYRFKEGKRQHYCFIKKHRLGDNQNPDQATFDYNCRRQSLTINDLKRYGVKSLAIDEYSDITDILQEIEKTYKARTVFVSGSAEIYEPFEREQALNFVHSLSRMLVENNFRVINGFGWGIGSSVINGALEAIYSNPNKYSEAQLILKPFPQFKTGDKELKDLWEEYRQRMISESGITVFLFGNKKVDGRIVEANGVIREFEISKSKGNLCIPIGLTNYASKKIFDIILRNPEEYYEDPKIMLPFLKDLGASDTTLDQALNILEKLFKQIKK